MHDQSRVSTSQAIETKALAASALDIKTGDATVADVNAEFERFMRNFESYKADNEARLAEVERRGSTDVVTAEKLARLDRELDESRRRLDEMTLKNARVPLGGRDGGAVTTGAALQHKTAFDGYVRKGDDASLRGLEQKAMSIASDPDGGYLVPQQLEGAINTAMRSLSPMRAIAGIQQVSSATYKRPFATNGVGTGWVGDAAARPQTATPTLAELSYPTMELYAMPAATASLLDDSAVNIDQWLADEVRIAFAQQEGAAFINGDGVNKPKGLLAYTQVDNGSWAWGSIGTIATGAAGALPATSPGDKLIDLVYAVKSAYRANGSFLMNRATQSALRKLKDGQGNYLWQPSQTPGEAPSLMGFPVYESEDMPDIAAGSTSIAFGDFKRGYLIVDRVGIRVLRDPYSAKPYVLFYTTKRVGGGVQDFDAIKLLKFA